MQSIKSIQCEKEKSFLIKYITCLNFIKNITYLLSIYSWFWKPFVSVWKPTNQTRLRNLNKLSGERMKVKKKEGLKYGVGF